MNAATAPTPAQQQASSALGNILAATQTRIADLRREADALERDVLTILRSHMAPPAAPGATAPDEIPAGDKIPVGVKPSEKRANGHAAAAPVSGARG